jgi:hypothetical protein
MIRSFHISTKWSLFVIAGIVVAALCAAPCACREPVDGEPVAIGEFRTLHSDMLGEDRVLLICLPNAYDEGLHAYPVLYLLYGDQVRGYFAETVAIVDRLSEEGSMPSMIIVGVANVDRYRDLSVVGRRGGESGIEPFSRFVTEELMPFIEKEYRTKNFRVLVGPQAGAEFGLYTLARRPGFFRAYILENPFRSQPVYDVLMPMAEQIVEDGCPAFTFVQITYAQRAGYADMSLGIEYMRRFQRMVSEREPAHLTLVTHFLDDNEDFILPLRLKEGLRELFVDFRFPDDHETSGIVDITAYYDALGRKFGFEIDVPERVLTLQADIFSKRGDIERAIEILDFQVAKYPASIDAYWRLANLHRERGDRIQAIGYYRKCLELMPNMQPARHWLEQLEARE